MSQNQRSMRVVIDTNVWISAMRSAGHKGSPALVLEKADARGTIVICDQLKSEICRVLVEKFAWSPDRVNLALAPFLQFSLEVIVSGELRICRDPDDDMILECAVAAGAEVIVSGDKDLLSMGTYKGIHILTPAQYLRLAD